MKFTDVAGIMNIPYVAEKVKLSHVAEIVKLSHVAGILEAGSMYDHTRYCLLTAWSFHHACYLVQWGATYQNSRCVLNKSANDD